MEFCCKFNGSMKFQIILFGLLLSLSVLNGAEYFYRQKLKPGYTYFAYNPGYPNANRGRNQCIWQTENSYNTQINCATRMGNCSNKENLFIKFANNTKIYNYCDSKDDISINGMNPFIKFNSTYDSQGGLFFCQIQNKDNICKCGQKGVTKIVGGTETGVNEFPMMAGLVDSINKIVYCGATIISEQYVITAGHCVDGKKINEIGVVVGEHNVTTGKETNATKVFPLYNYIIHPEYNIEKDAENDIAICKIIGIIKFNSKVGPACLPFKYRKDKFENKIGIALGWGTLEFAGKKSDTLHKVDLNVISDNKCRNTYPTATDSNICTYTPGKDACQMDSGGPLLWQDSQTHLILIGITSMGSGCATENPAIWMRVGAYINWIILNTPDAQYCQA